MADIEQQLRQAAQALRAGRKDDARTLLMAVVDEQEHNERAWLFLSAAVDTLEEQQICLENVLTINPTNDKARQGLERVNKALAARRAPAARSFVPPFTADSEHPTLPPAGDESLPGSGESGAENWAHSSPATSVDWGRADGAAVYGSGQQVDLPSEQEYDNWVKGLNLAGGAPYQPLPPEPAPAAGEDMDRARLEAPRSAPRSGRGAAEVAVPMRAQVSSDVGPAWAESLPEAFAQSSLTDAPPFAALADPGGEQGRGQAQPAVDERLYFQYIPDDIEPAEGGLDGRALAYLLAIVVLMALNAVSFGYLLR